MLLEVKKLANGFLLGTQGELPMFVRDSKEMAEVITQICNDDVELKDYLKLPEKKHRRNRKSSRARANKNWTDEEDLKLIDLWEKGEYNFGRLALEMQRPTSGVRQRAEKLGLKKKKSDSLSA